jgi:small subunit ribosomal protein S16
MGGKKRPIYRVVVADSRRFRDGKIIERLGSYNPQPQTPEVKLNLPRVEYWMGKGAQPTDTVRSLITRFKKSVPAVS